MLKSSRATRYSVPILYLVVSALAHAQPEQAVVRVENGKVNHHIDFSDFAEGMRQIEAQRR